MAIDLPPPAAPQQSAIEALRQATEQQSMLVRWQQYTVHLAGTDAVDEDLLKDAVRGADTLSNVLRRIKTVYYRAGFLAAQVQYALDGADLFVLTTPGNLSSVELPAPYLSYFEGLVFQGELTDDKLEPARTLASVHADRRGESLQLLLEPGDGGSTLSSDEPRKLLPTYKLGADFGNTGNRFAGRHLASYFAQKSFATGDEFRLDGRHALTGLERSDSPSRGYDEGSASWSHVMPMGIVGARGRYIEYKQELDFNIGLGPTTHFTGKIQQYELSWAYPLAAAFNRRWYLSSKLDYNKKTYEVSQLNADIQRQEYGSVEVGSNYEHVLNMQTRPINLYLNLAVRSGLGDDQTDNPLKAADFGYLLFRPSIQVSSLIGDYTNAGVKLIAQLSEDTVPEQQQWVVGGVNNVEAFLPGIAAGDSGGVAQLFVSQTLEWGGTTLIPRVYAEYGYAELANPNTALAQSGAVQALMDVGISVEAQLQKNLQLRLSYAESFDEKNISVPQQRAADANMFFSVTLTFP